MKKIVSLFARTPDGKALTREYHPFATWVAAGEGVATRKWDGTAVRWHDGKLWARYDAKTVEEYAGVLTRTVKPLPSGFDPCQEPDLVTGHWPGWVPATRPEDKWIREAAGDVQWQDGTYEACGEKINGNPEALRGHVLFRHGAHVLPDAPRTYDELTAYLDGRGIEGIVWWRNIDDVDCDKVKITAASLGVSRHGG